MTTIDLTEDVNDSQVRTWYKKLMAQVNEIDAVLDATADSTGIKKFTNNLVTAQESEWKPAIEGITKSFNEMPEDVRAGVYYGMIRQLQAAFKEPIDAWIKTQVEVLPKEEIETISDEEKKALQEQRSELSKQVNSIIDMAYVFGEASGDQENDPDPNWAKPKIRRGAFGKRGPRALSFYSWAIDGIAMEGDDNSNKGVSQKLGFEKVSEFTKALKDAKIDTTNPEEKFEVKIKDHEISAWRDDEGEEEVSTEPSETESEDE
jgi:hypothetical protein